MNSPAFFPPLLSLLLCGWIEFPSFAGDASPGFFPGGDSEIRSDDPDRARKAIRKWTGSREEVGGKSLLGFPYFWDFGKVGRPVYFRIVKNSNREGNLEVWLEDEAGGKFEFFKSYQIAYFSGTLGPKTKEGDLQAPEGFYTISRSRMNPDSSYHLSMDIGYPNAHDLEKGRTGSLLMIHGKAVSIGCFAMTDASIEQLYTLVDAALANGQPFVRVHCFPFPMDAEALEGRKDDEHYEFWRNLKEGWDWFLEHRRPPDVTVEDGRYRFGPDR